MKMTAKFEAEGESFNACFEQLNSAFNAEFSASGGGQDGKDGATFTPSVSEDGVISWTNDRELPNPAPVNIKGAKGDKGEKGERGLQGIQGIQGIQGVKGDKGDKGDKGADGADGITPVKGIDYFTEEDKAELVEQVLEEIPEGGGVTSWNDLTDKPDFAPVATSGSWNDLTDKPFGEGEISWVKVTSALNKTPTYVNGVYTVKTGLMTEGLTSFVPKNGSQYKIKVFDALIGALKYEHECVCTITLDTMFSVTNYNLGAYGDPVRAFSVVSGNAMPREWTFNFQEYTGSNGYNIEICEAVPKNNTLDEKYLPNSVVLESELTAKGYQTEEQVTALINNAISNLPRYNGEVEEI